VADGRRARQDEINWRVLSGDKPTENLGRHAIRGGAIGVIAQIVRTGLQIVSVALLARLLTPDHFGLVAMGGTISALVLVLTDLNITQVAVQREDIDQETVSGVLMINIAMGLLTVVAAILAAPLAGWLFKEPRVGPIIIGLAACQPISALGSMHNSLMVRNMRWLDIHTIAVASNGAAIVVSVLAAWLLHVGYWALVINAWTLAATSAMLAWIRCPWRPGYVRDWSGARSALQFGLHLSGAMILSYVHRQFDNILIGWRWGAAELGQYSRAYALLQTPLNFLGGPLGSTMAPAMSRMQHDKERWRQAYLDALTVITFIGGGMTCLLFTGANTIVDIALGPHWQEAKIIFTCLAISMVASVPMRTTGWIYLSLGRTNRMFYWALIAVPLYALSFVIGLPYGATGVALGYSISQLLAFFPCMWMATRQTNITLTDVIVSVAPATVVTVALGGALALVAARLDVIGGLVAMASAGLLYVAAIAALVWTTPAYQRLRQRAQDALATMGVRLGA
jgi:O-antigen/teichoic acid export membrane protein